MFGITPFSYTQINLILASYKEIEAIYIFGSRAMGNYKRGSDIDFAIKGENISVQTILEIKTKLNEQISIPYFCDVVHYNTLKNEALKEHIDTKGKLFSDNKIK